MASFVVKLVPQLTKAVAKEEIPAAERNGGTTRRRSTRSRSTSRASTRRSTSRSAGSSRASTRKSSSSRSGSSRRTAAASKS